MGHLHMIILYVFRRLRFANTSCCFGTLDMDTDGLFTFISENYPDSQTLKFQSHNERHSCNIAPSLVQSPADSSTSKASSTASLASSSGVRGSKRSVFSKRQLDALEDRFKVQNFLSKDERLEMAQDLGLTDRQVMVWFQNRRGRLKKRGAADKAYSASKLRELNRPYPVLYGVLSHTSNSNRGNLNQLLSIYPEEVRRTAMVTGSHVTQMYEQCSYAIPPPNVVAGNTHSATPCSYHPQTHWNESMSTYSYPPSTNHQMPPSFSNLPHSQHFNPKINYMDQGCQTHDQEQRGWHQAHSQQIPALSGQQGYHNVSNQVMQAPSSSVMQSMYMYNDNQNVLHNVTNGQMPQSVPGSQT